MRLGRRSRGQMCGRCCPILSLYRNRHPHVTHPNIGYILAQCTFDRRCSIWIHESRVTLTTVHMSWTCKVNCLTAGTSHTSCTTSIHKYCLATSTYKLSYFHSRWDRGYCAADCTANTCGSSWVEKNIPATVAYKLVLHTSKKKRESPNRPWKPA